ncbi:MAG: nickel pincer cofactor biosynthesis protein LarB [Candidatus Latescibacteria bacterium]|nr:nickel pincer cofactor biosynthesis protein LarB [Candidatus Latescibacterota bacterium]
MKESDIKSILNRMNSGELNIDEAEKLVEEHYFGNLGFANVDHHRSRRQGFPEVIFGQNKTTVQIVRIAEEIVKHESIVLATRLSQDSLDAMSARFPDGERNDIARTFVVGMPEPDIELTHGTILIVSAGTSDLPVAEEAVVTARAMKNDVRSLYDVGVAGIHRLLARRNIIMSASCIIVVAGMEGALASVVGGLVQVPVIACPTSVGYGASFQGLAALLTMLNSCASGISVVNIDNGFGAGYAAALINRTGKI